MNSRRHGSRSGAVKWRLHLITPQISQSIGRSFGSFFNPKCFCMRCTASKIHDLCCNATISVAHPAANEKLMINPKKILPAREEEKNQVLDEKKLWLNLRIRLTEFEWPLFFTPSLSLIPDMNANNAWKQQYHNWYGQNRDIRIECIPQLIWIESIFCGHFFPPGYFFAHLIAFVVDHLVNSEKWMVNMVRYWDWNA